MPQLIPLAARECADTFNQLQSEGHRESNSLTGDMASTRSQMILMQTRIGTDKRAPGTPQSQVQKMSETKMATGLRVKRRPRMTGVIRFDSSKWSRRYQAGGRKAFQR